MKENELKERVSKLSKALEKGGTQLSDNCIALNKNPI